MELDVVTLDDARDAWRTGNRTEVARAPSERLTLGAALEAACWAATGGDDEHLLVKSWALKCPMLGQAMSAVTTQESLPRPGDHAAPSLELRRCPSRQQLETPDTEWIYFLDRFRRSLHKNLGLQAGSAAALANALFEMVDNVVEHAGMGDEPTGVVGYQVSSDEFTVAVADLGRGVLASLRENSTHRGLTSDTKALVAAVTQGASRRSGSQGKGFDQLLRALADMEGLLFFRSGSGRLRMDGRGRGERELAPSNSPELRGFQLSLTARPMASCW